MADVLPAEQANEIDAYLAEKDEFVDASEDVSRTPSTQAEVNGSKEEGKPAPEPQPIAEGPIYTPPAHPLPQSKPKARPELTEDQEKKYDALLEHVKSWTSIPKSSHKHAEKEPLTDEDRLWLTRECLLRYLRATSWHGVDAASKRLLATLTWRREYGLAKFTQEYISIENETGKQTIFGYDMDGRPCLYMNPSKQNTAKSDRQLHHLVFMLERIIDLMPPGQETTALLINFKDSSSGKNPSVGQGRQTLHILQGHYPERLGRALISERKSLPLVYRSRQRLNMQIVPWYVTTFFRLISPFIDPVTKEKMKFNEPLVRYVPAEQLKKEFGGEADFEYKHEIYWPSLCELAAKRRKDYFARWEKAGKQIGEHEAYLRGGEESCLNGVYRGVEFPEGFVESDLDEKDEVSEEKVEEKLVEENGQKDEEKPAEGNVEQEEEKPTDAAS